MRHRWWAVIGVVVACVMSSACFGCSVVSPGEVGIVVNMAGSNRGVQDYPVRTGYVFYNPFTAVVAAVVR